MSLGCYADDVEAQLSMLFLAAKKAWNILVVDWIREHLARSTFLAFQEKATSFVLSAACTNLSTRSRLYTNSGNAIGLATSPNVSRPHETPRPLRAALLKELQVALLPPSKNRSSFVSSPSRTEL